uniref:Uncharacterized protein AlNc14C81G5303 n=1 Tax=Albugo laibachii Nc14 TaxID=890382 RepID=F0WFB3_9STRA|nr:conserved hypothetical protein [Albugo laibachii Nc14]|eukprot:CCA19895.1 conserved hypothetical protein [Albugo laibachii Nc14]
MEKHALQQFTGRFFHTALYKAVRNSAELRTRILRYEFDIALIDPTLILDIFQVYTAVARTLACEISGRLTTSNLHAELIFNLSGTRNVRDSLRDFGIKENSQWVLLCVFDANEDKLMAIEKLVDGECVSFSNRHAHHDAINDKVVANHYRVSENELRHCSLLDAVVSKIATKSWVK